MCCVNYAICYIFKSVKVFYCFIIKWYNIGQNISRLFHVLAQFAFTTSEAELDYYQLEVNGRVYPRVVERLKILEN